jgi:hypothetical protein
MNLNKQLTFGQDKGSYTITGGIQLFLSDTT